jgi:flagellar biosynthesis protein FliQ
MEERAVSVLGKARPEPPRDEILYTVQVSFREHALIPEPFLVVGLIAGIRRTLVLTAEFSELLDQGDEAFRNAMLELGLLTALIVGLVVSLAHASTPPRSAVALMNPRARYTAA